MWASFREALGIKAAFLNDCHILFYFFKCCVFSLFASVWAFSSLILLVLSHALLRLVDTYKTLLIVVQVRVLHSKICSSIISKCTFG